MNIPPFLSHLRTDRRGIPVPYINAWGTEDPADLTIEHDSNVRGLAVFRRDDHETVPDFTRQAMHRQRECMTQGLCQVCARFVPWSRRFLVVAAMSVQTVDLRGKATAVIHEPWLCERCGRFAMDKCPALIRRAKVDGIKIVQITTRRQVEFVTSYGWIEGPLEAQSRANPPAFWVKAVLVGASIEVRG